MSQDIAKLSAKKAIALIERADNSEAELMAFFDAENLRPKPRKTVLAAFDLLASFVAAKETADDLFIDAEDAAEDAAEAVAEAIEAVTEAIEEAEEVAAPAPKAKAKVIAEIRYSPPPAYPGSDHARTLVRKDK